MEGRRRKLSVVDELINRLKRWGRGNVQSESVLTATKPTKICFEKTVKSAVDKTEILFFLPRDRALVFFSESRTF